MKHKILKQFLKFRGKYINTIMLETMKYSYELGAISRKSKINLTSKKEGVYKI